MRWLWPVALLLCCLWHERDLVRPKAIVPALLVGHLALETAAQVLLLGCLVLEWLLRRCC